jgi:hypothetical protein
MNLLDLIPGVGPFADALTALLLELRTQRRRRNNEASAYFEQLGDAIEHVVEGLRKNEVPRISGHEMQTLIHSFHEKTKNVFTAKDLAQRKAVLEQAAAIASTLDGWVLLNRPGVQTDREQMIALLERITGDCRGLAGVLKKPA